jgi:1-deoxy-D-xylulose-5-phosphate synthase
VPVERIGWPDRFVEHGTSVDRLRASCGLSFDDIYQRVKARCPHPAVATVAVDA